MTSETDRERLRRTFEGVAGSYQRARPEYPAELFDDLLAVTGLPPGDRVLEVGCATGKATLPLARRGFRVTCVELGADLARAARACLAGFAVEVVEGTFEDWRPRGDDRFGLVFAATAWHWIDPAQRYVRAWEALRPGGYLAFWSAEHVFPEDGDPIFGDLQDVYDEIGEGTPPAPSSPGPASCAAMKARSQRAACSTPYTCGTSTGSAAMTRISTSTCWRRFPGTSSWPAGSGTGSTARSGRGWPNGRAGCFGGTGVRCCISRADATGAVERG